MRSAAQDAIPLPATASLGARGCTAKDGQERLRRGGDAIEPRGRPRGHGRDNLRHAHMLVRQLRRLLEMLDAERVRQCRMNAWLHAHKDHTEALTIRDEVLACGHEVQHGGPALLAIVLHTEELGNPHPGCVRTPRHRVCSLVVTTDPKSWAFACRSKVM